MKLLLLWHMHQPMYKDYRTGQYRLPWVYLHALKDYYEMAWIASRYERLRMTFNLVPSLIESLEDYASGRAQDPFLAHFRKAPEAMEESERAFLVEHYFLVPPRAIDAHPRYRELRAMRDARRRFAPQDLRDLQVLFHLQWLGESWKRTHQDIRALIEKGQGYREEDKRRLQDKMAQILRATLPLYRRLWEQGRIEISTTPYYHPIVPLLCDTEIARRATPRIRLDDLRFRFPEDAREQIARALEKCEAVFGRRPQGMWPAEGAVSEEAVQLMAEAGIRWTASDSAVLIHSLPPEARREGAHWRPYRFTRDGRTIALFFRDHELSDMIGFVYSRWRAEDAAEDFIRRLRAIHERAPDAVVSVILDGENPWEHYPANGYDFLTRLYSRLDEEPWIETLTFSDALAMDATLPEIRSLHPGSWIEASFTTWIGDEEKNTAWRYLERARRRWAASARAEARPEDPQGQLARRSLLAAEGSDWFWWFGEPHHSPQDPIFDELFRAHLKNVYVGLGLQPPSYLETPVRTERSVLLRTPVAFLRPVLDGRDTHYFEWAPAGMIRLQAHGAMHRASGHFLALYFGFDPEHLYLRIDFREKARALLERATLQVEIYTAGGERRYEISADRRSASWALADIVEIALPLAELSLDFGESFDLVLVLTDDGIVDRYPPSGALRLHMPGREFETEHWMV
jgi:alpha-amylase/alpha-mannosidase (GH57 family)